MQVNILTRGLPCLKSRAVIFPILRYLPAIQERGISCRIYRSEDEELTDCSTLVVDSRFYMETYEEDPEQVAQIASEFQSSVDKLLWFDTSASTGTINTEVLDHVDGYYKKQLLKDRSSYLEPSYYDRPFSEYYYQEYGVADDDREYVPSEKSAQVESEAQLDKLGVFWNSGLVDYSPIHPMTRYPLEAAPDSWFHRVPWKTVMNLPFQWRSPKKSKSVPISARFSTSYSQGPVQFHRELMVEPLEERIDTSKVNRFSYWNELRNSKIVLSPFGWGEMCWRDFEGLMNGCVVVKPGMDHLETWPQMLRSGETMRTVEWDMSDLEATVDEILDNPGRAREIAERGQKEYRNHLFGEEAKERFVNRFVDIVAE